MDIRPIRNDADLSAALARIDQQWGAEPGTEAGDTLEVLAILVEAYETAHFPTTHRGDAVDTLKFLMDENDRTQADLAELLGSRSRASEILNRRRSLTLDQIRLLHRRWGIPAGALIGNFEDA
jgi:HTH-type transcriptional regulator / antitoxin HigA